MTPSVAASLPEFEVVDIPEESRLVLRVGSFFGELVYEIEGDNMRLVHTGVPQVIGHRGIGGRLVQAAVELAREAHLTLVPSCPFARQWIRNHPVDVADAKVDWDTSR